MSSELLGPTKHEMHAFLLLHLQENGFWTYGRLGTSGVFKGMLCVFEAMLLVEWIARCNFEWGLCVPVCIYMHVFMCDCVYLKQCC